MKTTSSIRYNQEAAAYYNQLAAEVHANSLKHGWWEDKPSMSHFFTLVVCELAEAVEADRMGKKADITLFERRIQEKPSEHEAATYEQRYAYWFEAYIKDSVGDELADAAVRLLDMAGAYRCDFSTPFAGYAQMVSPAQSFTENISSIMECVLCRSLTTYHRIASSLVQIEWLAAQMGIDLAWHIKHKMLYNANRPYKHGKAY